MADMCDAAFAADWDTVRRMHERWLPLMKANFLGGPNPVPVKAALSLMGLSTDMVRLPLLPLEEAFRARLRLVLETTGAMEFGASGATQPSTVEARRSAVQTGHRAGHRDGPRMIRAESERPIRAMMAP
jgi:hypothetical protein